MSSQLSVSYLNLSQIQSARLWTKQLNVDRGGWEIVLAPEFRSLSISPEPELTGLVVVKQQI